MGGTMTDTTNGTAAAAEAAGDPVKDLAAQVTTSGAFEAARLLEPYSDEVVVRVLQAVHPSTVQDVLDELGPSRRQAIIAAAPVACGRQWLRNQAFLENSVGRLMDPPIAVFRPETTVGATIEQLRDIVKTVFITYGYVADSEGRLVGVVVMRELLFADPDTRLETIMIRDPFFLRPDMTVVDAMRLMLKRHYPEYPVCDAAGHLVGVVRGAVMFEAQAFELSAQAGSMVGVEREERLSTPWLRSLKFRHPWLQLNLLTAFVAGGVVGIFQGVIDEIVILAVFLPVLAGQSGNTGCQALAVTLRGMTLGDLLPGGERRLVGKEALLGLLNGSLVGATAGLAMFGLAMMEGNPQAVTLGLIVLLAMIGSCIVSGISGALVPLTLKRLGADPATASSIFLTTSTDVASMGLLLGLATLLAS
jgi:magnesium transporter